MGKMVATKRILITGGLGYLGGRIAKYLSENTQYYIVLGVRNSTIGRPAWLVNGEIVNFDVANKDSLDGICKNIDIVIHLAAINDADSLKDPEFALQINTVGTLRVLESAISSGIDKFIYFSTAHVYGKLSGVIDERVLPSPTHPYAITHHSAEEFVLAAHSKEDITGVVLRLSNGMGVPERPEVNAWMLIVNDLCKQAVITGELVLKSSGLQKRNFIPISDISKAVDHMINLPNEEIKDSLFNLGSEKTMSIIEVTYIIANRCEVILGFKPEIVVPDVDTSAVQNVPDFNYKIDKLKNSGFNVVGDIGQEIDDILLFCKKYHT